MRKPNAPSCLDYKEDIALPNTNSFIKRFVYLAVAILNVALKQAV